MRLAFITQDFPPQIGGIQTYSIELTKRLYKYCDDFFVIAPYHAGSEEVDQELPFDVYRIKCSNTWLGIASIPEMLAVLKQRNVRITFHAQWQTLLLSVAARRAGIIAKITVAAHARELFFNPFEELFGLEKWYEQYMHYLLKQPDHFFPVSRYTADILQGHGIRPGKIDIMINGTNPDQFYPLNTDELKSEYGFDNNRIILTVSRLVSRKGIDTTLNAFKYVLQNHPASKYLIVGEGPYQKKLQLLAKKLGIQSSVKFEGRVPYENLIKYYNMCDVFVMPSKTQIPNVEGFGIVFLEANACQKPVIGSFSGGIPSAIVDEETGLLVEEQNPQALADAINKLLSNSDLARKMGKKGRKRVENEANWDVSAEKLANHIKNKI